MKKILFIHFSFNSRTSEVTFVDSIPKTNEDRVVSCRNVRKTWAAQVPLKKLTIERDGKEIKFTSTLGYKAQQL